MWTSAKAPRRNIAVAAAIAVEAWAKVVVEASANIAVVAAAPVVPRTAVDHRTIPRTAPVAVAAVDWWCWW